MEGKCRQLLLLLLMGRMITRTSLPKSGNSLRFDSNTTSLGGHSNESPGYERGICLVVIKL